jgi:hypothetical protein
MTKEKGKIDQLIRLNAEATTGVRLMQRRSLPGEAEITLPPRRLGSNAHGRCTQQELNQSGVYAGTSRSGSIASPGGGSTNRGRLPGAAATEIEDTGSVCTVPARGPRAARECGGKALLGKGVARNQVRRRSRAARKVRGRRDRDQSRVCSGKVVPSLITPELGKLGLQVQPRPPW